MAESVGTEERSAPERAPIVLSALILVAAVANLNLSVANVALPDIGMHFNASQTQLNLVAVAYSAGLAASVLWLGAVGDRHGRKAMLLAGVALSVPACMIAAWAPSVEVLIAARLLGGLSAGMAFPTTLALITALWVGPPRTRAIALWSALGGAISALGPLAAGALLERYWWGSVFVITLPLAFAALVLAARYVPAHAHETTEPVDSIGGALSVALVGAVVMAINFAVVPGKQAIALGLGAAALVAGSLFVVRQRSAPNPLYDLDIARRRLFWVAACSGIIVFGALMASLFVGQQYLQNVLGYSSLEAGLAILPSAGCMILAAPLSAKLIESRGSRLTLLAGYTACLIGFVMMLLLWEQGAGYAVVGLAYAFVGVGVGLAGTPASNMLTSSVPVTRAGMASGTADLQRDLGGAIMQSILGALLTAGYASAFTRLITASPEATSVSQDVQDELKRSFASASNTAARYPGYAEQIISAAKQSFLDGQRWAHLAAIIAVVAGGALVLFMFPDHEGELALLTSYREQDDPGPT